MCSFKDLLEFPIEEVPELRFLFPVVDLAKQRLYFVYLFFGLVAKKWAVGENILDEDFIRMLVVEGNVVFLIEGVE